MSVHCLCDLDHYNPSSLQKQSKYAYAISALRTLLHQFGKCLTDTLSTIERLAALQSDLKGHGNLYCYGNTVDIGYQPNYHCLIGMSPTYLQQLGVGVHEYPRFVKQRSEEWHQIRHKAFVTGREYIACCTWGGQLEETT